MSDAGSADTRRIERIDAQVHIWEKDHPGRPWDPVARKAVLGHTKPGNAYSDGETVVSASALCAQLDEIGIDGAILVSSGTHYGGDNSYALESAAANPRFAAVGRADLASRDVEGAITAWRSQPRAVGLRLVLVDAESAGRLVNGEHDLLLRSMGTAGVPLCLYAPGILAETADIARRHPDLQIVLDHLGGLQPPMAGIGADHFAFFPDLLSMAEVSNVAVKLTGLPTLSATTYPYPDLAPWVRRLLDGFGPDRVMWGTDATRTQGLVSYREGAFYLDDLDVLTVAERAPVLGGTVRRIFNWPDES